ncbi:aminoglycoside phosphotransferase family protein [Bacillus pretiosus]|uniref:Aminoglycoside phosphotransferase family protein n=1 Tax=Bacillus pretiosus TaxID=2983392 RepID=A0ABT3F090_9BACI|nr:aminoglycoside phosphotransferase family protein [Bacillus pretiosus]MCW1241925.1 aminoglycoside phosphotransferase family protein [Bacillus pretiosus]
MTFLIEDVINCLSSLKGYSSVKKIENGYSPDKKFIVTTKKNKYFIRLSDLKHNEKRNFEFSLLKELEKYDVQTNKAIEYTLANDKNLSVMVLSYIEGKPASEIITDLSDTEQLNLGFAAGKELRKIHQLNIHKNINWEEVQTKKFTYYLNEYKKDSFQVIKEHKILNFIDNNFHLLKHRPITLLHDDFHLGHIITLNNSFNGIIDFNGYDFGDPYHDFYNLSLFSRRLSIPYCIGQVNNYFLNEPDDMFWRLYALYAAMNIFSTIVWTKKYDEQSFDDALERIDFILQDHDYFIFDKPLWYKVV